MSIPSGVRGARSAAFLADLLRDVLIELSARRLRVTLTLLAVALSTGALLAAVSVSATASRQIDSDLAASTLNRVTVSVVPSEGGGSGGAIAGPSTEFPDDADERVERVEMVLAAGRRIDVTGNGPSVVSRLRSEKPGDDATTPAGLLLTGLTPGYLEAAGVEVSAAEWMLDGREPVAFLGLGAARELDIVPGPRLAGVRIWVNGTPHQVAGYFRTSEGDDLHDAVVLPYRLAHEVVGTDAPAVLLARVAPGGGSPVALVIRDAIRPEAPERFAASQVVTVDSLRRGVETQMARLVAGVGGFLLALTALLIANSMIVSVVARTGEIGLRRALGATRRAISAMFLCEGALVGAMGGLAGSALGLCLAVGIAVGNSWSPVIDLRVPVAGPVVGALVGLISASYPALRAGRVNPAVAVRSD